MENIMEKINEIVDKLKDNEDLMKKFQKDPVKAIKGLVGVDLPDEMIEKVVDGVKAKVALDKLDGAAGFLKKLF